MVYEHDALEPLPCDPALCHESPECVEGEFSEVGLYGVLRSSPLGMLRSVGHGGTFEGVGLV
jgi:hypothetical protein